MELFNMVAPCLFGTESIAAGELRRMGIENIQVQNGRVLFKGDANMLARANINSRFCERIYINVGEFSAESFEELFQGVKALEWENFIGKEDAFPVNGWSIDSALHSIPDCQKIVKKAIVERLKSKYSVSWFNETGCEYKIRFSILKNHVTLMIDTSGEPLHKRAYRRNSTEAPIKETLAASMCDLARIYPDTVIYDPFCGSGTILIEASLMATKTAPGLRRFFAAERFGFINSSVWQSERARATDLIQRNIEFKAYGSDVDPKAVELTLANAKKAGVEKYISVTRADVADFKMQDGRTLVVTNPPYGERLLDLKQAEQLYKTMGQVFINQDLKKYYIISPHDEFETFFGRKADKKRKLYNGMLKCQLFMYNGGK